MPAARTRVGGADELKVGAKSQSPLGADAIEMTPRVPLHPIQCNRQIISQALLADRSRRLSYRAHQTVKFHFDFGSEMVANTQYDIQSRYSRENLRLAHVVIGRKIE